MEKVAFVLACLTYTCEGRRVQAGLAPSVGVPTVSAAHTAHRSAPPVAQNWYESGSLATVGPSWAQGSASTSSITPWDLNAISAQGGPVKRIEGQTRKTWSFNDMSRDRVSVAVGSEGRPVHTNLDLWIGPDWTPFKLKAYSENGRLRPIQTLVGTRNKVANIDIMNTGPYEMSIAAAAAYAEPAMAEVSQRPKGEQCQGSAIKSYVIDPETKHLEVCLRTDGKQLNAKIELLNSPNNPKQTYEVFTNNGELNSLCVCFDTPDVGTTVRVHNLATVEFPCYINLNEIL